MSPFPSLAKWLNGQGIAVDLAITCDPVPKVHTLWEFLTNTWSDKGTMQTVAPPNVDNWINYYQELDADSMGFLNAQHWPLLAKTNHIRPPRRGHGGLEYPGACCQLRERNKGGCWRLRERSTPRRPELEHNALHCDVCIPELKKVRDTIEDQINDLPQSKDSYEG